MPGSGKAEERQRDWIVTGSSGLGTVSSVFPSVAAEWTKGACFMYLPLYVPELQWYLRYTQICYSEQSECSLKIKMLDFIVHPTETCGIVGIRKT